MVVDWVGTVLPHIECGIPSPGSRPRGRKPKPNHPFPGLGRGGSHENASQQFLPGCLLPRTRPNDIPQQATTRPAKCGGPREMRSRHALPANRPQGAEKQHGNTEYLYASFPPNTHMQGGGGPLKKNLLPEGWTGKRPRSHPKPLWFARPPAPCPPSTPLPSTHPSHHTGGV